MKPALRTSLLLAAVVTTGVTACQPGVYVCACPPNLSPRVVCGAFLNRHGTRLEPAITLGLVPRSRRVARAPAHSAVPQPAGWGINSVTVTAITISTNCERAPVVTVTPAGGARTLAIARAENGGIAGLTLAQTSNTTIAVRAYRGHRLIGRATIPQVIPPAPPTTTSPSPSPTSVPCRRAGHRGGQGPQPLYCLSGPILPNAD